MSSSWDEIKRLAADFQKVQLSSTLQRLSERNCVEIVTLLIEKKLVNVLFTNDGKEYITPEHLEREILDELYVHGGRVNLVELSKILNVDISKISDIAEKITLNDPSICFMLGQLINDTYTESIAHEINEKLARQGEISISELTLQYDIPSEFLQTNVLEKYLGKIIKGRQDPSNPRVFFTQAYIQKCKAKIRGALAAITQPISISAILQQINVPEKIFHTLSEELSTNGTVTSKQSNAQYIPNVYSKMQAEWVASYYRNNGYIDFYSVKKIGISDPKQFIKKALPDEELMYLNEYVVGNKIIDLALVPALNECMATKTPLDIISVLSDSFAEFVNEEADIEEFLNEVVKSRNLSNNFIFVETTVFPTQYLNEIISSVDELLAKNAKEAISSGSYQKYIAEKNLSRMDSTNQDFDGDTKADKRDDRRRKAAAGKAGGGAQGRETKTKSTKKHQRNKKGQNDDNDSRDFKVNKKTNTLTLVTLKELDVCIGVKLNKDDQHLGRKIAELYHEELNQKALQLAQTLFESTPQTDRRQTHSQLQDRINVLLNDIRLYDKGSKLFPTDMQAQLEKYLLKSLGSDIVNELIIYAANESSVSIKNPNNLNVDQRNKIAQNCAPEYRTPLIELNKSLNSTVDQFLEVSDAALKACSMILKKVDKKKDRSLIVQHKEKLIEQLKDASDPALILHLASLILFSTITGCILHASGRFVSQILTYLKPNFTDEQNKSLMEYHDLVLRKLSCDSEAVSGASQYYIDQELNCLENSIKDFAIKYEKPGIVKAD